MEVFLWILIVILFILSFVGILFPSLPSVLAIWGGFLLYHFFINPNVLSTFFWVSMAVLTVILLLANFIASTIAVDELGGSNLGKVVSTIAIIVGSFIYPPFGTLILPFLAVLIIELWQKDGFSEALRAAIGTFIGFLGGKVAEFFIQIIMVVWFFLVVWF